MARIPAGREVLQVTVDVETATLLRVKAALRRITVGRLVEELARHAYTRDQVIEEWGQRQEARTAETVEPGPKALNEPPVDDSRRPQEALRVARPKASPQERQKAGTDTMTWSEMAIGLNTAGRTHKELREFLGLTNISQWAKEGVPPRHVPKIRDFLSRR